MYFNIWRGGPPGLRTNRPTWQVPGSSLPSPPMRHSGGSRGLIRFP